MLYKSTLLGAVALSIFAPALAQDEDANQTTLDTVIIEGSRLNQTAAEIGSSVTIITADDIERLGYDFALDAIAAAPGVTINSNGAFGGVASVRIRGAATAQTLVLIDGVQVNDPTSPAGGFDFARLDTENIERIEILKGPQSTLWGTDAIGGVVSIITKRPEEGLGGSAFGEYGSFNTFRGGASIGNANDMGDFRLAIVGTSSDGISKADEDNGNTEEDPYEALTLSAKGGLNLGQDARLSADILWSDAENDFDSFSATGQGGVADGDVSNQTEELSANVSLTAPLFNGRLDNLLLIGYSEITRQNFFAGAQTSEAEGERVIFRYQGTLDINDQNTVAFGAERDESTSNGLDASIDGLFAVYEFKPVEALTLTGGLRVDDHEEFGSETTGRIAAAYNPNEQVTLRATWGQGFKAPTIFQTTFFCCGATAPNADLQPETSEAFEVGLDWRSTDGRAEAGITVFDQDLENQIDFDAGTYFNIAEVESQGFEIYGGYQFTDWLTVTANYANINAEDGDGDELSRIPEHSGDITFAFDPEGPFSGSALVRYNGEEQNTNNTTLDSWTRVDLAGSYDVSERVELFARVENLFDEDYQQILGYGTPDLSGYIGLRLRY